ncbi:MAG TPA: PhzF family phenazine biosynthesis isomerase [Phototrophicaceae bacterium]|jgi:PhzF family phenazine biosynthesis protein|nr:PhzF family phenazine biosynthesis isomerase [Phototrophicaceae bacterium]
MTVHPLTVYEVAAFTADALGGSLTGVILNAADMNDDQMQAVAKHLPYSHTAFMTNLDAININIRFFTAAGEIQNCAHATIAAHYLRAALRPTQHDEIVHQHTASGIQEVTIQHQSDTITVSFKQNPVTFSEISLDTLAELLVILKLSASDLDLSCSVLLASPGANRFMVAVKTTAILNSITPNFTALKALCDWANHSVGCFVFVLDDKENQATARMFAPGIGVDEDTINGNSSGCLGAYLLRGNPALSEIRLRVHQGHLLKRPGTVLVTASRTGDRIDSIETTVGGTAVITATYQLDPNNFS